MKTIKVGTNLNAARLAASSFGVLAGIGGITHGVGEILQGNIPPESLLIDSWTQGPIAELMGGDPGMTIVPNLLATGILAILVSLSLIIWALAFVQSKHGGLVLIMLSIAMMLVGGGFGSPIIGILAGVAGTKIHAPLSGWQARFASNPLGRFLAWLWPLVFGVSFINAAFLFIGAIALVYLFRLGNQALFLNSFYFAVVSVLLTVLTGMARDSQTHNPARLARNG